MSERAKWRWWTYSSMDYLAYNRCRQRWGVTSKESLLIGLDGPLVYKSLVLGVLTKTEPRFEGVEYIGEIIWSIKENMNTSLAMCHVINRKGQVEYWRSITEKSELITSIAQKMGGDDYLVALGGPGSGNVDEDGTWKKELWLVIIQDVDGELVQFVLRNSGLAEQVGSVLDLFAGRTSPQT